MSIYATCENCFRAVEIGREEEHDCTHGTKEQSELERLREENARLRIDSARLNFLIQQEFVIKEGISSFWLAEPDGTSRVGYKYPTAMEAIDAGIKELGKGSSE